MAASLMMIGTCWPARSTLPLPPPRRPVAASNTLTPTGPSGMVSWRYSPWPSVLLKASAPWPLKIATSALGTGVMPSGR